MSIAKTKIWGKEVLMKSVPAVSVSARKSPRIMDQTIVHTKKKTARGC